MTVDKDMKGNVVQRDGGLLVNYVSAYVKWGPLSAITLLSCLAIALLAELLHSRIHWTMAWHRMARCSWRHSYRVRSIHLGTWQGKPWMHASTVVAQRGANTSGHSQV